MQTDCELIGAGPAGKVAFPPDGQWKPNIRGRLHARLLLRFPDGLVELDPARVVAPGPVAVDDVLSGYALRQTRCAGAVEARAPRTTMSGEATSQGAFDESAHQVGR